MTYPRFVSANVTGALVWGAGLVVLGNVAYEVEWVRNLAYIIAAVAVLASLVGPVVARLRARRAQIPSSEAEKADR